MRLKLSISPCPNDTFMFEALINGRIDTRGLEFDVHFADIEELNNEVMGGDTDVSKISYAVLPEITEKYVVLGSGSALGHGNGPLLVARERGGGPVFAAQASFSRVAIPGVHTTANLLLKKLFPQLTNRTPVLFSEIAAAVARGEFDAGVLIHEGRFTFHEYGLELVADLGVEWAARTSGMPLPLGAIVARKDLAPEIRLAMEEVLRESILFAMENPEVSREFVKKHAQEMADEVIDSHIALFVNENSLTLSDDAKRAVRELTGVRV